MATVSSAEPLESCRNAFWWQVWLRTAHLKFLGLTSLWFCLGSSLVSRAVGCPKIPSACPLSPCPLTLPKNLGENPGLKVMPLLMVLQINPLTSALWSFIHLFFFLCFSFVHVSAFQRFPPCCSVLYLHFINETSGSKWALGLSVLFLLSLYLMKILCTC